MGEMDEVIQTIPSKYISERLLEQIVEQIADAHAPSMRDTSYRDERTSKATEKKENLEADVASMKVDAGVGEDPFARVKGLITELISQMQKGAFEDDIAKYSSTLETAVSRSTSESANEGHPDKICDQVSAVVIDACFTC